MQTYFHSQNTACRDNLRLFLPDGNYCTANQANQPTLHFHFSMAPIQNETLYHSNQSPPV